MRAWLRFLRRAARDEEFAREMEAHLTIEIDELVARGVPPDEARARALRKFGNTARVREEIYDMNSLAPLDTWWQDLKYAARLLARDRGFATAAILSLALGIGANAAMFQLLDAVRLRALPVASPDELVEIRTPPGSSRSGTSNGRRPMWTHAQMEELRARQQVFSGLAVWSALRFNIAPAGEMRFVEGLFVSGDFFPTLGVEAVRGRLLTPADDRRGCEPAAVISHAYWRREFGGSEKVLDESVFIERTRFPIVGVASPSFFGVDVGRQFDVAVPLCADAMLRPEDPRADRRDAWWLAALGRLRPGVTAQQASSHLESISPAILEATLPGTYRAEDAANFFRLRMIAEPAPGGVSGLRRDFTTPLVMLLGLTGLVLLIACANLANLLLARATVREREMAVRLAIGASRVRVLRQLIVESVLLAACGALAGAIVGAVLTRSLVAVLAEGYDGLFVDLAWNTRLALFTAAVAGLACLCFGVAPAFRATALSPATALKSGARGTTGGREGFGVRRALVVVQVALSIVLLAGSVLFSRTLYNLLTIDPGFEYEDVLVAFISHLPRAEPGPGAQTARQALHDRLAGLPEAAAAALADVAPLSGSVWNEVISVVGEPVPDKPAVANFNRVSPGYFDAVGVPLIAGRTFNAADSLAAAPVAIVTDLFVRRFIPDGRAIGRRVRVQGPAGKDDDVFEIVGVAGDVKALELREEIIPMVYLSAWQERDPGTVAQFLLRPRGDMEALAGAVTRVVREVDAAAFVRLQRLREEVRGSLVTERLTAWLSISFGALAAVLAAVGLFGVLSYNVARRANEIGVRLALGAERGDVLRMVLGEAGRLLTIGVIVGVALAAGAARWTASLLYGLEPWDPWTFIAASALLVAIGLIAGYLPAARASRVDPATVLRGD